MDGLCPSEMVVYVKGINSWIGTDVFFLYFVGVLYGVCVLYFVDRVIIACIRTENVLFLISFVAKKRNFIILMVWSSVYLRIYIERAFVYSKVIVPLHSEYYLKMEHTQQ